MKQSEKAQIISDLTTEISDFSNSWNNGRNDGIMKAISIISQIPTDAVPVGEIRLETGVTNDELEMFLESKIDKVADIKMSTRSMQDVNDARRDVYKEVLNFLNK